MQLFRYDILVGIILYTIVRMHMYNVRCTLYNIIYLNNIYYNMLYYGSLSVYRCMYTLKWVHAAYTIHTILLCMHKNNVLMHPMPTIYIFGD